MWCSTMKDWGFVMLSVDARRSLEAATCRYSTFVDNVGPYLEGRGISREAAVTFRLGCVVDPLPGDEPFTGRLAIPYLTPAGVVQVRYRAVDDSSPKYLGRAGDQTTLFNVLAFQQDSDVIAVCEGELDTIVAWQCGIAAVGLPGATSWKRHYARAFDDYRVLVLADGDPAGRELGKRVASSIDNAVVISMPEGADVTDVFLWEGRDGLLKKIGLS